jgi:hypothetical protein
MTEEEWLGCDDPTPMLEYIREVSCNRKLRLFAISAIRLYATSHGDERTRKVIEVAEIAAEGGLNRYDLHLESMKVGAWIPALRDSPAELMTRAAGLCIGADTMNAAVAVVTAMPHLESCLGPSVLQSDSSPGEQTELIRSGAEGRNACRTWLAVNVRDIFGNPFRSVGVLRQWRTSTVVALAQQMYDSRDFSAMPILADALQDAGCDNADILDHCRGPGPHVRGCWVVDLVLSKE